MPSCSSSSNIQSTTTFVNVTQGGSRLIMTISAADYAVGIAAGDVIRYDITNSKYFKSKADALYTSEVVGIVESLSGTTLNVVIYGSINLPAGAIEAADTDTTTGGGGNDIYFLSATTSGKVRVLAPTDPSHIVKPLYQVAPHGNGAYTGIVMNYIGYKVGGDAAAFVGGGFDGGLGAVTQIIGESSDQLPTFYVDTSISHTLPISQYGSFWAKYANKFGSIDLVTLNSGTALSKNVGKAITSITGSLSGKILSTSLPNKYYVERPPNSQSSVVGNRFKIIGDSTSYYEIGAIENYAARTPIINSSPLTILSANGSATNMKVITGIKIAGDGTTMTIPNAVVINSITADTVIFDSVGGSGGDNLATVMTDFESRIAKIESRLLL